MKRRKPGTNPGIFRKDYLQNLQYMQGYNRANVVVTPSAIWIPPHKSATIRRRPCTACRGAHLPGILSLILLGLAIVGVFINIPIVSNYAFWFVIAAFMIRLLVVIPDNVPHRIGVPGE